MINGNTGEIIDVPVSYFRRCFLRDCLQDGVVPLMHFLDALPIEGLGPEICRQLASVFDTWADLVHAVTGAANEWSAIANVYGEDALTWILDTETRTALQPELPYTPHLQALLAIPHVGPRTVGKLIRGILADELRAEADALSREFTIGKPLINHIPYFANRYVVFTGQLSHLSRSEARRKVEAAGAIVTGRVTSDSLVVVGADPGRKLREANDLGAEIIDEEEFLKLIGEVAGRDQLF